MPTLSSYDCTDMKPSLTGRPSVRVILYRTEYPATFAGLRGSCLGSAKIETRWSPTMTSRRIFVSMAYNHSDTSPAKAGWCEKSLIHTQNHIHRCPTCKLRDEMRTASAKRSSVDFHSLANRSDPRRPHRTFNLKPGVEHIFGHVDKGNTDFESSVFSKPIHSRAEITHHSYHPQNYVPRISAEQKHTSLANSLQWTPARSGVRPTSPALIAI